MKQVLVEQKRDYIQWFTDTCRLKEEKCTGLLELLLDSKILLSRVRFVENISFSPNSILISAKGSTTVSFLFKLDGRHVPNVETMIHELIANPPEEIHVWLSFNREKISHLGQGVVEGRTEISIEHEFMGKVSELEKNIIAKNKKRATNKEKILQMIDQALMEGDRARFNKLSKVYKKVCGS